MDHTHVAEALAETCYKLGCRGQSPLEWNPRHLFGELDETRMMEAYIKYKLVLGRERWGRAPTTPRLWEENELKTKERNIKTKPITFHRALAEMGIAECADIYDKTTKDYYTVWELCKKYGVKNNTRITQEYSNVKRQHRIHLQDTEQGALKIIWESNKGEMLETQEDEHVKGRTDKVISVTEKGGRRYAGGGGISDEMEQWRTKMGKEDGGCEYERGGCTDNT
eukprot:6183782-Pleurochrysis_carterae.AAC.2